MSIIQGAGEGKGREGRVLSGEGYHSTGRATIARAFMSLSRHPSQSCSKAGRSFGRHPLSLQSWSIWVIAGWPTRLLPWLGDQSSSRLLVSSCFARQEWPAKCILCSRKIVEMSGMGPWSCSLVGCLQFGEAITTK